MVLTNAKKILGLSWLERMMKNSKPSYRIYSPHNDDLIFFLKIWVGFIQYTFIIVILAAILLLIFGLDVPYGRSESAFSKFLPMLITAFGIVFTVSANQAQKTIDQANRRLGVVDLFTSEILSVMNVIVKMRLIHHYKIIYHNPGIIRINPKDLQAGSEKYTEIFEKNASELGSLKKDVVESIARFYTYLRASRDATRRFSSWEGSIEQGCPERGYEQKQDDVQQVVLLLSLSLKNGVIAAIELLDDRDIKRIRSLEPVLADIKEAIEILRGPGSLSEADLGIDMDDLENMHKRKLARSEHRKQR